METLLSFPEIIAQMRESDYRYHLEKYEQMYGPIPDKLEETEIYKRHLSLFKIPDWLKIEVPEDLEDDYDWDMLILFIVASYSSDFILKPDRESPDMTRLLIQPDQANGSALFDLNNVWHFQVEKLYKIYIAEQMDILCLEDDEDDMDSEAIIEKRQCVLDKFLSKLDNLLKEREKVRKIKLSEMSYATIYAELDKLMAKELKAKMANN